MGGVDAAAAYVVGEDPTTDGPWELIVAGNESCETIRFELDAEDGAIDASP